MLWLEYKYKKLSYQKQPQIDQGKHTQGIDSI